MEDHDADGRSYLPRCQTSGSSSPFDYQPAESPATTGYNTMHRQRSECENALPIGSAALTRTRRVMFVFLILTGNAIQRPAKFSHFPFSHTRGAYFQWAGEHRDDEMRKRWLPSRSGNAILFATSKRRSPIVTSLERNSPLAKS